MSADQNSRPSNSNRRLVAILFADIQGYTSLMQSNEQLGMTLLQKYQSTLNEKVSENGGEIIKNFGDGSLCVFSTALGAVSCAKALQQEMLLEPKVPLRIGLHLGDVIYGNAINLASRIESMGVPGSVLISQSLFLKVRNQSEFSFRSLGSLTAHKLNDDSA